MASRRQQHEIEDKPSKFRVTRKDARVIREVQSQTITTLRERIDAIRQAVGEAARRLEMGAALELEHSKFGLPAHRISPQHGESVAWKMNAAALTTWLRGEAEILHRIGEGIE